MQANYAEKGRKKDNRLQRDLLFASRAQWNFSFASLQLVNVDDVCLIKYRKEKKTLNIKMNNITNIKQLFKQNGFEQFFR